jgi:hypothetical protein
LTTKEKDQAQSRTRSASQESKQKEKYDDPSADDGPKVAKNRTSKMPAKNASKTVAAKVAETAAARSSKTASRPATKRTNSRAKAATSKNVESAGDLKQASSSEVSDANKCDVSEIDVTKSLRPRVVKNAAKSRLEKILARLSEDLLPSQESFVRSEAPFKGFSGPVGSGKSEALIRQVLISVLRNPGTQGILGAPTVQMLRDATLGRLLDALQEYGIEHKFEKSEQWIKVEGDAKIILRPLEDVERIRGQNVSWFGVDELTYVSEEAWMRLEARLRDPKSKYLVGFAVWTPKGKDWVWKRFISGEFPTYEAIKAQPRENRYLLDVVPDYYDRLQKSYSPEFYRQEVLGEYTSVISDRAYPNFQRQRNLAQLERESCWDLYLSADFNRRPLVSVVAQKVMDELQVLDELVLENGDIEQLCRQFLTRYGNETGRLTIFGDANGHQQPVSGQAPFEEMVTTLRRDGKFQTIKLGATRQNPAVKDRLDFVNHQLLNQKEPKIKIDSSCLKLVRDLEEVTLVPTNPGERRVVEIDKVRDPKLTHLSDAFGYLVWGLRLDETPFGFQRLRIQ